MDVPLAAISSTVGGGPDDLQPVQWRHCSKTGMYYRLNTVAAGKAYGWWVLNHQGLGADARAALSCQGIPSTAFRDEAHAQHVCRRCAAGLHSQIALASACLTLHSTCAMAVATALTNPVLWSKSEIDMLQTTCCLALGPVMQAGVLDVWRPTSARRVWQC